MNNSARDATEKIDLALKKINALQEAGTREIDTAQLRNAAQAIEELLSSVLPESLSSIKNSLGLAYRRLGERGDRDLLKQAIVLFEEGIILETQNSSAGKNTHDILFVELRNNLAIASIRMFELEKDADYLNKAEVRLDECVAYIDDAQTLNPLLRSNVHNNIGNLWKQRYTTSQDLSHAEKALQAYGTAETFSSEQDFPYFWATVQKNKGEIKYLLSKTDKNDTRIMEGLVHCFDSLHYRDRVTAPYQWLKSIEILFDFVVLSPESLSKESGYREKIISVLDEFSTIDQTLEHKNYLPLKEKYQKAKNALESL